MADLDFIHQWIPGNSKKTLLLLHGTGGNEDDLVPLGKILDPDANLLSPRGRIDENGSNRFFRRFSEGVFDQVNMRAETEALAQFLIAAEGEYGFDRQEVWAIGFSNGANIGASLLLRYPELLRGGIFIRAMVPFEPESPPALLGTRVLICSGESDPMVSRENAERLAAIFVEGGADVEHLWVAAGHNLTRQEIDHAKSWLARM